MLCNRTGEVKTLEGDAEWAVNCSKIWAASRCEHSQQRPCRLDADLVLGVVSVYLARDALARNMGAVNGSQGSAGDDVVVRGQTILPRFAAREREERTTTRLGVLSGG